MVPSKRMATSAQSAAAASLRCAGSDTRGLGRHGDGTQLVGVTMTVSRIQHPSRRVEGLRWCGGSGRPPVILASQAHGNSQPRAGIAGGIVRAYRSLPSTFGPATVTVEPPLPKVHRMSPARFSPLLTATAVLGMATLLAACGGDATPDDTGAGVTAASADSTAAANAGDDGAAEDDSPAGGDDTPAGGGIETLESDALHDGVETAAAGMAYVEIEGERLEFTDVECSITDEEDAKSVNFTVEGETSYGLTELWVSRSIGWGVGFDYEEELVQVSHLSGEVAEISMAQNSGDEDGGIDWHRGDGPDPLLAMVGSDVTATGALEGHPGSENPQEGAFVMAAHCG